MGEAINAIFPKTKQQLCIVHQIRNSTKFMQYKDCKGICADPKKIYGAVNLDDAEYALEEFREKWTMPARNWTMAYSQIMIYFADRFAA